MTINTIKQDLESAIDETFQKMYSEDLVAIISQIITDKIYHSCQNLLLNYLLENTSLS